MGASVTWLAWGPGITPVFPNSCEVQLTDSTDTQKETHVTTYRPIINIGAGGESHRAGDSLGVEAGERMMAVLPAPWLK